jgi:ubiquinone/menaquinone biosynthesis C-methylase UbiE
MSSENQTIHDFDFNLICEYFSLINRQGPGSTEMTLKALSFIEGLNPDSRIADLGCGTGAPTMDLAQHAPGHITGLDLFPRFIDLFNARAASFGLQDRVQGIVGSMDQLPFQKESLDLIWSEGAIYNIGFERGLKEWRSYLKPGGFIAVSEASWFTNERPEEITKFWQEAYPAIDTISAKTAQMERAGYIPVATFILPEICWMEEFYHHQPAAQLAFLKQYPDNPAALGLVENERREAALYDQYKAYYGYAFYIGQKIG